ncbi:hypothetical protein [Roseovarius sp. 2305UL8-3]|uniref:hypothetical protein n=1 Tax=Roseovarius conchicola TaxID=3121636 RepID=UPI0035285EF2
MFRYVISLCFLLLSMSPARACWDAPEPACFTKLWSDQALSYVAEGPRVARLYHLIDWGVVPRGEAAARTLLEGLSYDALAAHQAAQTETEGNPMLDMLAPNGTEKPSVELALLLMMGYLNTPDNAAVPTDYLLVLYDIARQTGDLQTAASWFARLPDYLQADPDVVGPDGSSGAPDLFAEAQAHAIATLAHLQSDEIEAAQSRAAQATGEPAFMAWKAIARHAIEMDDMGRLAQAVTGMRASFQSTAATTFDEEAFERAIEAAEAEYSATGDPDALVYAYESADPSAYDLPPVARLSVAVAARYLSIQTGETGDDGFDAALAILAEALQSGLEEDSGAMMRNARTALRLGLEDEATQIIDMALANDPGVPSFELFDLPDEAEPWAETWVSWMLARYNAIIDDPSPYETRDYWSIWVGEDALSEAIELTRALAFYEYRDETYSFALRASAYLGALPTRYPDLTEFNHAQLFERETAPLVFPADVASQRMQKSGMDVLSMAYAFADAKRPDIALIALDAQDGLRNLGHWMTYTGKVPEWQRPEYITALRPLIEDEIKRLAADGYPELAQDLSAKAAVFMAGIGDWPAARGYYDRLEDVTGTYGPAPAIRNRLIALRDIAAGLSSDPPRIEYPYEDFAL